ncbi:interferon regulatory factor 1-like [Dunckerocampus dactyliophorus]|uniref:interferon regulatory factor 1-like n=1 Tax=Dunckerocampus dactyliophorus TaxID=161453 RepID=UPI00240505F7|nr:interferon regulatory factor 1-like [Dunckerocampus dactyliophorus]
MRPAGRLRLRMWLEEQIESGKYPGVCWLDKSEKVFQIPWKHAARQSWSIDRDATLFRSWAMHTGRYHPGKHQADPKTWKANFRCALNSLPDVCELREHSKKSGSDAYRVYKMLPRPHARKRGLVSQQADSSTMQQQEWQPPSTTSSTDDASPTSSTDDACPSIPPAQDTWEDLHEQDQAGCELLEHFSSADPTSNQTWAQKGWRSHPLWDHWHCSADDNIFSLHADTYSDLLAPNCSKEVSDWSIHQQTIML